MGRETWVSRDDWLNWKGIHMQSLGKIRSMRTWTVPICACQRPFSSPALRTLKFAASWKDHIMVRRLLERSYHGVTFRFWPSLVRRLACCVHDVAKCICAVLRQAWFAAHTRGGQGQSKNLSCLGWSVCVSRVTEPKYGRPCFARGSI